MSAPPVEAIVFDIGNVLLRFDYARAHRALREQGCRREADLRLIEDATRRYECGAMTRPEFIAAVRRELGHGAGDEAFVAAWEDIFEPEPWTWALVEELHGRYPLFLLSNIGCIHREHVFRRYPVFGRFSGGVYSHGAGVMKPDPRIYAHAVAQFGVNPAAVFYLDDVEVNVEAARAAGWQAEVYGPDRRARILEKLGKGGVRLNAFDLDLAHPTLGGS